MQKPGRRFRPRRGWRGQSVTELALAAPVFFALVFGLLEMGMLYKTHAAYQEAALEAARAGSAVGASDADALSELQSMLTTENLSHISSVQVYDATAGAPITATVSYTYSNSLGTFVCAATGVPPATALCNGNWNASARNTTVGSLDTLGIRIAYKYYSITGVFPPLSQVQTAAVQLEPSTYSGP